ncbi:hypothetical protein MVEN_01120600 [Mycena venus]|uniref:Ubiquitin-like protease family profile domain-containing protein n=1 Tax=Mycena venus TaxID=2733690 RepID=A0A8H6Y9H2_9AGAR|nr:hypothetical protein MVEN_01120600 [Mycena venus]
MAPGSKRSVRANQPAAHTGLGIHFKSPLKQCDRRKKSIAQGLGRVQRTTAAQQDLDALLRREPGSSAQDAVPTVPAHGTADLDANMADWVDMEPPSVPSPPLQPREPTENVDQRLNDTWNRLLPLLETPWLRYYERTHGKQRDIIPAALRHECTASCEGSAVSKIKCLYPTHVQHVTVSTRSCKPAAVLLVEHGVFPASPTRTKTGLAIDLLDFYRALFERSCDVITVLAAALHTVYDQRGFKVLSEQHLSEDERALDPFRRLLIQAVQWVSNLRDRVEKKVAAVLAQTELRLSIPAPESTTEASDPASATVFATSATASVTSAATDDAPPPAPDLPLPDSSEPSVANGPSAPANSSPGSPPLKPGHAHRVLRERCPACFNLDEWGRSLVEEGGDVQLGGDGCFSYRHLRKAGDGPISYDPSFFIPKHKVDAVAEKINAVRKRPATKAKPSMPQEVLDACQDSWDAANEKKRKADPKRYDASGVFVMTCRHGQVIFLCNIDTPGEQQRYIVAMLEEVFSMLPPHATVLQAYDVGCVTDHSLNLFPIFPTAIRERLLFIINGMHAYGHHWACQLLYSPRFRTGMGIADHEAVERFWSRIRKLIPLTRAQWNSRRIWMLDQYAGFMSDEGRTGLGNWIHRQQRKNLMPKYRAAMKTLQECRVPERELRTEWAAQKKAQTSMPPARLRRELDKVLSLQTQIDTVEKAIDDTKKTLQGSGASPRSLALLHSLEKTHERLSREAEDLYTSLNIQKTFPELQGLPLEFAQTLLVMRDLKINIRKRAIGSFFEWESLDRAVSGRREPLGTKLHQSTRKAISKRQPSLLKAIKKFNTCCQTLERLRPPQCTIPIPSPLSTQLNGLRNDPSLHEDVWITPSEGPIPRWLNDEDVRDGIRSLHIADRCAEEVVRLNLERNNLRRWLLEEQEIVKRAIEMMLDSPLAFLLRGREDDLVDLERSWAASLRCQDVNSRLVTESGTSATTFGAFATTFATPFVTSAASASTLAPITPIPTPIPTSSSSTPLFSPALSHSARPPPVVAAGLPRISVVVEADDLFEEDQANLIEEVLDDSDEDETETSTVEATTDCLDVRWEYTAPDKVDAVLIRDLAACNASLQVIIGDFPHFVVRPGLRPLEIGTDDLKPFFRPTRPTQCARYSPTKASADQCAVLSTYDLPCVRYKGSDPDLWCYVAPTRYWEKPLWLIPIHQPLEEHWVLVVVVVPMQELFFFDSMASRRGWRQDLRDVMVLITRMVALSNRNQHPLHVSTEDSNEKWVACPLFNVGHPRQTNGYDCGLWVLCMMAVIMRGHRDVGVSEADMPWVRRVLREHVQTLPIT